MFKAFAALVEKPRDITFDSQEENEEILLLVRRHLITAFPRFLLLLILSFLPIVAVNFVAIDWSVIPSRYQAVFLLIWYLFLLAFFIESFVSWYFDVFIVTPHRILDVDFWGLMYKNVSETVIGHIEDVTYSMGGIVQSLFNFGTISIQTAAEAREFEFPGAPNPARIHDVITDLVQAEHRNKKEDIHDL